MLRIAVPNKGMLSEPAWNMLAEAGYRLRTNPRQLVVQDPDNGIELFYLRPLDIAVYVGRGAIDVGITGQDLLKNSGTAALEHMPLGFGASTFRFAAPNESPITTLEDVQGKRVATTFDKLVHDYLVEHGIQAETIHLDGAVESSVQLGVADLIESVDSEELLRLIDARAVKLGVTQDVLLEVNIGAEESKSGFLPTELRDGAAAVRELDHLRVLGLMAIPPVEREPHGNLPYFVEVSRLYVDISRSLYHNSFVYLSMGMSDDFEDAIAAGATVVRVGSAIFGRRHYQ